MANIFGAIIGMVLAVVSLAGVVMPTIHNINTSGVCVNTTPVFSCAAGTNVTITGAWSGTETILIGLGGICVAAGIVYTIAAGVGIV